MTDLLSYGRTLCGSGIFSHKNVTIFSGHYTSLGEGVCPYHGKDRGIMFYSIYLSKQHGMSLPIRAIFLQCSSRGLTASSTGHMCNEATFVRLIKTKYICVIDFDTTAFKLHSFGQRIYSWAI